MSDEAGDKAAAPPDAPRAVGHAADLGFFSALQLLVKLRGFIIVPVMMRRLGAEGFGVWVQLIATVSLAGGVAHGNVHVAMLRYFPGANSTEQRRIVGSTLAVVLTGSALAAVGLIALAPHFAAVLGLPTGAVRALGALVVSRATLGFVANVFRARDQSRTYAVLDVVPLLSELAALVALLAGADFMGMVGVMVGLELLCAAAIGPASLRGRLGRPSIATAKRLLKYSLPSLPMNVSSFVLVAGDRYLISGILGNAAVGAYSAAYTLCSVPAFFVRPLTVSLLTKSSKLWDGGDRPAAARMIRAHVKLFLSLALPASAGVTVLGPAILAVVTGRVDAVWHWSLLVSISLGTTFFGLLALGLHVLMLEERMMSALALYVAGAGLNLGLNLVLLRPLGLLGAGLATAVAYAVVCVPVHLRARRRAISVFSGSDFVRIAMATLVMAGGVALLPGSPGFRAVVGTAAGVAIYGLAMWLFGAIGADERALLREVSARVRRKLRPKAKGK